MKIFYFCFEGFSKLGNINNHVRETITWLSCFGNEVHFYNPSFISPEFEADIKVHPIPVINLPLLRWITFEFIALFRLIIDVVRFKPDHLYFRETSSFVPIAISKLFHLPFTVEVNGWVLEELRQTGYSRWKIEYMRFNQRINYSYCDRLIPVSDGLKKLILQNYPVSSQNIYPISNGTNPDIFRPIPRDEARKVTQLPDKQIVGFIGSCYHYHGVQHLIKAAPLILKKLPGVYFVIAGDGAQLEEWKKLTMEISVNNSFTFTGQVPFDRAPYYINSFDICVAPWDMASIQDVGLSPMKLFDYLSCGKAVIASPVAGVKELIQRYTCAILTNVEDARHFADVIIHLLENPILREDYGTKARQVIIKNFTWEITSRKIQEVLHSIR